MAATASPFGLRPTNMIGGAPYNAVLLDTIM